MHHSFNTIADQNSEEHKEKGSRFIAFAFRFSSETELKPILQKLRSEHFKAVHWCWAYRIDQTIFRSNDDGEPAGTAGKPILNVLISNNLEEVLVVVVRYFGGTLLGVPGLIKAYKEATSLVIGSSEIIEVKRTEKLSIQFGIEQMNIVMKAIKAFDIKILTQNYTDQYQMDLALNLEVKSAAMAVMGEYVLE